jgi:hypothetical protein
VSRKSEMHFLPFAMITKSFWNFSMHLIYHNRISVRSASWHFQGNISTKL